MAELLQEVSQEPLDWDWAVKFFEMCKDVGNEDMQSVWAKILAGETAQPGSFSLRTLALVKTIRKVEAELFTKLCSFVLQFPEWPATEYDLFSV